jgi:hypothetical protein
MYGATSVIRTRDLLITSQPLYRARLWWLEPRIKLIHIIYLEVRSAGGSLASGPHAHCSHMSFFQYFLGPDNGLGITKKYKNDELMTPLHIPPFIQVISCQQQKRTRAKKQ